MNRSDSDLNRNTLLARCTVARFLGTEYNVFFDRGKLYGRILPF